MTRAASWSIKGVGFDARQAAEEAARRAGMSLGEWMNDVIAEQAAEMGVDVEEFGEDDRMEALAGRLSRMSGRDDDENRRWRESRRARRPRRSRHEEDDFEPRRPSRGATHGLRAEGLRAEGLRAHEAERLLENAVDAFERRSARASSRTAAALASVADRLGDLEARLDGQGEGADDGVRDSLDRLEQRMESLARRAARPERDPAEAGLRDHVDGALRDIGARLDHVVSRLDRPAPARRDPAQDHALQAQDQALRAMERKLSAVLDAVNRPARDDARLAAPARDDARYAPAASSLALSAAASGVARPRVGRAPVSDLVAEIERRQRDLDEPGRAARRPAAPAATPAYAPGVSPEQLDARLDQLAQRFERAAHEAAKEAAQQAARQAAEANAERLAREAAARAEHEAKLAAETRADAERRAARDAAAQDVAREAAVRLAQESALLAAQEAAQRAARDVAARSPAPQIEPMMRDLQGEVGRLAERLEEMRKSAARPQSVVGAQEIDDVRREIAGIARSMQDLDARQPIAQLDRAVRDLARRVETSRADGLPETVVAPVARFADEMREALKSVDPRPGFAAIERALQDVARRFDGATARSGGVDASELAALRAQNAEIRALVEKAMARPADGERLERQIAALGDRLDRLAFTPAIASPPEIAQAIGEIRAMMAAAVPTGSLDSLETRVAALSDQIARLGEVRAQTPVVSHAVSEQLDRRLGALADKMDRLGAPAADAPRLSDALDEIRALVGSAAPAGAVKALERQIEGLAGRLDKLIAADPQNDGLGETLGEIRALIGEGVAGKGLERQIAGLADRLDRFASERVASHADGASSHAVTDAMSDAMRELRQMMAGGDHAIQALERRVADLADRIGAPAAASAHDASLDAGLIADEVARRIRVASDEDIVVSGVAPHQEQALRALLSDISERVSEIRRPGLQDETLYALRAEIGRLAERLDRAEDGSADASALSRAVATLMERIDRIREATAETAHEAARAALREAMQGGLGEGGAPAVEIEALKARQSEAERRSSATLGAVHDTLEKIVDRLAQIEDEVEIRQPAQAPASVPQRAALARAVPDDGFGDEPLGLGQSHALSQGQHARAAGRVAPAAVPSAVNALAEDLLIDPSEGRGPQVEDVPERRDAAAFIAAARRMTQQSSVEAPEPPSGIAARAAQAAQAARAAILAKTGKGEAQKSEAAAAAGKPAQKAAQTKAQPAPGLDAEQLAASPVAKRSRLAQRKRPILIGLIGLTLALGALMYMNITPTKVAPASSAGAGAPAIQMDMPARPAGEAAPKGEARLSPNAGMGGMSGMGMSGMGMSGMGMSGMGGMNAMSGMNGANAGMGAGMGAAPGSAPIPPAGAMSPPPGMSGAAPVAGQPSAKAAPNKSEPATTATLGPAGPLVGSKQLRDAASAGDASAAYESAVRLLDGRGAEKDPKAAAQWLERAAGAGLAPAQYRLAALYEKGVGVPRDVAKAKSWYQRAAEAGHARAMHNLAVLIADGVGDKPDYAAAAPWFVKAAELGVRDSQYNLAILYARGLGLEQNLALSYTWFATAAKQGDADAGKKRDEIAAKLDPKLLEQAKQAADMFRSKPLDRAANEVSAPPGGWDKAEAQPYGGVGVRPIGRPSAG